MTGAEFSTLVTSPLAQVVIPVATFLIGNVCGFVATRFTMPADKKQEMKDRRHEIGKNHQMEVDKRFIEFCNAMARYVAKKGPATLDDFQSISMSGDMYFSYLKIVSDAVMNGNVEDYTRRHVFVPALCEALEKNIPQYYGMLQTIADRMGTSFTGRFERANYESIFLAVEKYASREVMPPVANGRPKRGLPND